MCCGHSAIAASAEPGLGLEVITRAYIVQTPIALLVSARRCGGSKESRIAADGTRLQATRVMGLLRRRCQYSGGSPDPLEAAAATIRVGLTHSRARPRGITATQQDRKSTRLNSSHL